MKLTRHTDYGLRVLIYQAVREPEQSTTAEIAARYRISEHHLTKVVQGLARAGFLDAQRGRGGGLRLAREPSEIRVGDVVRALEPGFDLVECFRPDGACPIRGACVLEGVLGEAMEAFLARLDAVTLADLAAPRAPLVALLIGGAEPLAEAAAPR